MRNPLIVLALLTATAAQAIQPEAPVHTGIEPQRVFRDHPAVQARLAAEPGFHAFREAHPDWQARFDEATGKPWLLWGGPIPVPTDSTTAVADAVRAFFLTHADTLGLGPSDLVLRDVRHEERVDSWFVDFDTTRRGAPIWRGGLTARVKRGNLVMVGALAYGDQPTVGSWDLAAEVAIATAIADGPAPEARHTGAVAERMWLPMEGPAGIRLIATWLVRSRTTSVPGKWVSFVDATSGELLSVHNEVRFAEGSVTGWHHERTVDGSALIQSPLPEALVTTNVDAALTALDGSFSVIDGPYYSTDLHGDYVEVVNTNGPEGELSSASPELDWTTANATQAEISTYVFLHQVRTWGERVAPENRMVTGPVLSNVNVTSGNCNAYFDGDVNFYAAGGGCQNTGQIADVNYHEWGHGFHLWSVQNTWAGFDGSLSEGAADTVAFLQTGESTIAPYFFNGGGGIRNVSGNRSYPDDYSTSQYAVHDNGLIYGGAMWDLWQLLMDEQGVEAGTESTEQIFASMLKSGPTVADSYEAAIFADDDDGNLANGTPNECAIIEAFGQHGLGPLGSTSALHIATHIPQKLHSTPEVGYAVEVEVRSSAPNCFTIEPVAGAVHFRIDGGNWEEAALSVAGATLTGEIPAQATGSFVEYYLQVEDAGGADIRVPSGGEINPHSFYNGPVLEVSCEDFERNRGQYSHELVSGEDGDGADDWQWGVPGGNGGDPSAAYSGLNVWGNDLGWDQYNGEYQSDKKNRLWSPTLATHHYLDSFLSFQRWLNMEDGSRDVAKIRADGSRVWVNFEGSGSQDHLDRDWSPQAIFLKGAGDDGSVVIDWAIETNGSSTFGGWNIDDVCILAPDTADNRLGISGLTATRAGKGVTVAWTNPRHEPANRVMLLRNDSHLPTGPADGLVVWQTDAFELGAKAQFVDQDAPAWDVYYAAFGASDTDVLSWSREGFNAAVALGTGPASESDAANSGACGCANASSTPGAVGLFLLTGALGLRRRRGDD